MTKRRGRRRHGVLLWWLGCGPLLACHGLAPPLHRRGRLTVEKRNQPQEESSSPSLQNLSSLRPLLSCLHVRGGDGRLVPSSVLSSRTRRTSSSLCRSTKDANAFITGNTINNANQNLQGMLSMALAALSFSLMFLGVKLYSDAPTFTLVFYRSVVQALLSGSLMWWGRRGNHQQATTTNDHIRLLLIARGTLGSLAVAAMFAAIQGLPLPDAVTLQFTVPVFAALVAVPLLGEPWRRMDQIGAVVCLTGVMLMARPSWLFGGVTAVAASTSSTTVATIVGLVGAFLAALAYILVRQIGDRAGANLMVWYYAVISALTAPLGARLLSGTWDVMGQPTPSELAVFAGLGVFGFLGQFWTNRGLNQCESAAMATLITNTQIVFAFLFEVTILHESISPWSLAGTALIVGYMGFVGIQKMRNEKNDKA